MKYCKNCGQELSSNAQFCKACGTPVNQEKKAGTHESNRLSERQPISPKKKKWLIAGTAAAIILLAVYLVGQNLLSKDRMIYLFEEALNNYDEKAIAKILGTNDKKLEINKETVGAFVKYYQENPEEIKETVDALRKQAVVMDNGKNVNMYDDLFGSSDDQMVRLVQDGKFLVYDKYELMVDSVYLTVETNYKDTELTIDGKTVGKANQADFEKTYGPYVPGIHELQAKLKTDFVDLVVDETVTAYGGSEPTVNLYLDGKEVQINTSVNAENLNLKGKLYVNGKDVGVNPFKNPVFGPVLTDGCMKVAVEAELPWGKVKTKEKEIDRHYVDINFGENEETQKGIMDAIVKNNREALIAYTSGSTSKMSQATDNYKKSVKEDVDELKVFEQSYTGKYMGTVFDLNSFTVSYMENAWTADVSALVSYQDDTYFKGDSPSLEDRDETYAISLIYDEKAKKWLVDSMVYTYSFDDENTKEVKEKSPKQYTTAGGKSTEIKQGSENDDDLSTVAAQLMDSYLNGLISAINHNNFSAVSPYMKESSELYKSQKSLVGSLYSKGTSEELVEYEVTDVKENDGIITISTNETIKINYSSGKSETKDYEWTYKAVNDNGAYLLTSIE